MIPVYKAYYDSDGILQSQLPGYAAIAQEWDSGHLVSRTYLDSNGMPINRIDGYSKAMWEKNENGTWIIRFFNTDGKEKEISGLNLVRDVKYGEDGWSEWMMPEEGTEFANISIGSVNLGVKHVGDYYTCQLEVEFRDVSSDGGFNFRTHGSVDGA